MMTGKRVDMAGEDSGAPPTGEIPAGRPEREVDGQLRALHEQFRQEKIPQHILKLAEEVEAKLQDAKPKAEYRRPRRSETK